MMDESSQYFQSLEDYDEISRFISSNASDVEVDVKNSMDTSAVVGIFNLPIVNQEKLEKLVVFLLKSFEQIDSNITSNDIIIPFGDEQTSLGIGYARFSSRDIAALILQKMPSFKLGKNNVELVLFDQIKATMDSPDDFVEPYSEPFVSPPNPGDWLNDVFFRDQFAVRYKNECEIFWANFSERDPDYITSGDNSKGPWSTGTIKWSPKGTYFVTFHEGKGFKIWGSKKFILYNRFKHESIFDVEFSPDEKYVVSYPNPNAMNGEILVFSVETGEVVKSINISSPISPEFLVEASVENKVIRGTVVSVNTNDVGNNFCTIHDGSHKHEDIPFIKVTPLQNPNRLKWAANSKFLARLAPNMITVYTVPEFTILDKCSVEVKGIVNFKWSPEARSDSSAQLAFWSLTGGSNPRHSCGILSFPSREVLCSRSFADSANGELEWQSQGDYLSFTSQIPKHKKTLINVFRCRTSKFPMEQLERVNEMVSQLVWEPAGHRFAIIKSGFRSNNGQEAANAASLKPSMEVFSMGIPANDTTEPMGGAVYSFIRSQVQSSSSGVNGAASKNKGKKDKNVSSNADLKVTSVFSYSSDACNEILWSPLGGRLLSVFYGSSYLSVTFFNADNKSGSEKLAVGNHDRGNFVSWDPSGRMVTTAALASKQSIGSKEDGVQFFDFQGNSLTSFKREKMLTFEWRPRPMDALYRQKRREVLNKFAAYEQAFLQDELKVEAEALAPELELKRSQIRQIQDVLARNRALTEA